MAGMGMDEKAKYAAMFEGLAGKTQAASQQAIGEQTRANRPNQVTPWGSMSWSQDPSGNWTQSLSLDPKLQGMLGGVEDAWSSPLPTGEEATKNAYSSIYSQGASRLDPVFKQREDAQRADLLNQGLDPGTEAYGKEYGNLQRARNDAYDQLGRTATEMSTDIGGKQLSQNIMSRMAPLGALGGILGLSRGMQMPGFMGAGAWQPGNYLGAGQLWSDYVLGEEGQQRKQFGDLMNGIIGAGGNIGAAGLSDERLKTDIVRYSIDVLPGVPLASWNWRFGVKGRHLGVIAQDLEKVAPHLVVERGGYKYVKYAELVKEASRG